MPFRASILSGNKMFRQDKIIVGVLTGLLYPVFCFIIFYEIKSLLLEKNMIPEGAFKLQFLCIISVVTNVIPAGSYVRAKKDQALKGIAGITLLIVAGIIIYFNEGLLSN